MREKTFFVFWTCHLQVKQLLHMISLYMYIHYIIHIYIHFNTSYPINPKCLASTTPDSTASTHSNGGSQRTRFASRSFLRGTKGRPSFSKSLSSQRRKRARGIQRDGCRYVYIYIYVYKQHNEVRRCVYLKAENKTKRV